MPTVLWKQGGFRHGRKPVPISLAPQWQRSRLISLSSEETGGNLTLELSDSVTVADELVKHVKSNFLDAITVGDTTPQAFTKVLADAVTPTDTISLALHIFQELADAVVVSDEMVSVRHIMREFADAVAVSDDIDLEIAQQLQLSDQVVVGDEVVQHAQKFLNDVAVALEEISVHVRQQLQDTATVVDEVSFHVHRQFEDVATFTDALLYGYRYNLALSDEVASSDSFEMELLEGVAPIGSGSGGDHTGHIRDVRRRKRKLSIELSAERLLQLRELPASYPEGAKKAFENFQAFYGTEEGKRIFLKKALEQGTGATLREKIASIYKTGATVDGEKKADVVVRVGKNPQVIMRPKRIGGTSVKIVSRRGG